MIHPRTATPTSCSHHQGQLRSMLPVKVWRERRTRPDFESQQAFANLGPAAAGARPEHVVKITTLVVEHNEFKLQHLGAEVKATWGEQTPAQTLIPVPSLRSMACCLKLMRLQ